MFKLKPKIIFIIHHRCNYSLGFTYNNFELLYSYILYRYISYFLKKKTDIFTLFIAIFFFERSNRVFFL